MNEDGLGASFLTSSQSPQHSEAEPVVRNLLHVPVPAGEYRLGALLSHRSMGMAAHMEPSPMSSPDCPSDLLADSI